MADADRASKLTVRPFEGVGPIDFGMLPDEVDKILGTPEVRHTNWGPSLVCLYGPETRLRVTFDQEGGVALIDVFDGNAIVEGVPLIGSYAEMAKALQIRGHDLQVETVLDIESQPLCTGRTIIDSLGMYLWRDDPDAEEIDTCGAYRRPLGHGSNAKVLRPGADISRDRVRVGEK